MLVYQLHMDVMYTKIWVFIEAPERILSYDYTSVRECVMMWVSIHLYRLSTFLDININMIKTDVSVCQILETGYHFT